MSSHNNILLQCSNLTKEYPNFKLDNISFSLEAGCILGVIGCNGSGKTTLVEALLGCISCLGSVTLNGISLHHERMAYQYQTGFVLTETPFPLNFTPADCGKLYGRRCPGFDFSRYLTLLETYEVPPRRAIRRLSKGQQIKQQLAFALSCHAALYIMDEPNANLDISFRDMFCHTLRELTADESRSVIYVSNLVEEMERFADYILWLSHGKTKYFGTVEALRDSFQIVDMDIKDYLSLPSCKDEKKYIAGAKQKENHQELLVCTKEHSLPKEALPYCRYGDLKEIMYYIEKAGEFCETDFI